MIDTERYLIASSARVRAAQSRAWARQEVDAAFGALCRAEQRLTDARAQKDSDTARRSIVRNRKRLLRWIERLDKALEVYAQTPYNEWYDEPPEWEEIVVAQPVTVVPRNFRKTLPPVHAYEAEDRQGSLYPVRLTGVSQNEASRLPPIQNYGEDT